MNADLLYAKLVEAGEDWADKQSAANVLEDTKNAVLAKLMLKSTAPSVSAREVEAKASDEYEAHVVATQKAVAEALKAKVKYEAMKVWIECKRTEAANLRAEMRMG